MKILNIILIIIIFFAISDIIDYHEKLCKKDMIINNQRNIIIKQSKQLYKCNDILKGDSLETTLYYH